MRPHFLRSSSVLLSMVLANAACASREAYQAGNPPAGGQRYARVFFDSMPTCAFTVLGEVREASSKQGRSGAGTIHVQARRMGGDAIINPEYRLNIGGGRTPYAGTVIQFDDPSCRS